MQQNVNTTTERINILGSDNTTSDFQNKGLTILNPGAVRWNNDMKSTMESQLKHCPSNRENKSHLTINQPQQYEIKISSVASCHDNMTTTDTTGSYVSSASNIDLSSTSIRDGINI